MQNLDAETLGVLKTQDLRYIESVVNMDKRKISRLVSEGSRRVKAEGSHLKFAYGSSEINGAKRTLSEDDSEDDNGSLSDGNRNGNGNESDDSYDLDLSKFMKPQGETIEKSRAEIRQERKAAKRLLKAQQNAEHELRERIKRQKKLELAAKHLVSEKMAQGKGAKRKIAGKLGEPPVYKFKRVRNR